MNKQVTIYFENDRQVSFVIPAESLSEIILLIDEKYPQNVGFKIVPIPKEKRRKWARYTSVASATKYSQNTSQSVSKNSAMASATTTNFHSKKNMIYAKNVMQSLRHGL